MGAQDTVCPVLLSVVFPKNYAGSLSVGQALFGLGSFAAPFLIGLLLAGDIPFYYAYYSLLLVPAIMLLCMPFVKLKIKKPKEEEEKRIRPLYVKRKVLTYAALIVLCASYSAAVSTLNLYISSFAGSIGISEVKSAFMLTVYNIGAVIGSLVFAFVLKKIKAETVLLFNNLCAFLIISIALIVNIAEIYFAGMFFAGFFLGVLFSSIVSVTTRIGYRHISIAGSLVATTGGISDILTPVITGFLVSQLGVGFSFIYAIIMIVLSILAAAVLQCNTTEKEGGSLRWQ